MSKKTNSQPGPATPVTQHAASRAQSAVAKQHGGKVPAGSYIGRLQQAASKSK